VYSVKLELNYKELKHLIVFQAVRMTVCFYLNYKELKLNFGYVVLIIDQNKFLS